MTRVTLGIDLGTGSTKAVLVDADGRVVAEHSAPHPAAAQVATADWWRSIVTAVRGALANAAKRPGRTRPTSGSTSPVDGTAGLTNGGTGSTGGSTSLASGGTGLANGAGRAPGGGYAIEVVGVGLSGQMHGVVPVDAALRPLAPATTWASTGNPGVLAGVAELARPYLDALANPVVAGMPAVTLRELPPSLLDATHVVLAPKDWLGAHLTGVAVTDPTDASASLLWDVRADGWHAGFVAALGLDGRLLPEVRPSDEVRGLLLAGVAEELGLPAGVPVTVGRADVAAALVGAGVPGALLSVGTGGQLCRVLDAPVADPTRRTHLFRGPGPAQWYAMAATLSAGLALGWVRAVFGVDWTRLYDLAFESVPGANGVTFRPHLAGERTPHLDPGLSAAWSGLRLHHTRADVLRAAVEGTAFALREAWDALVDAGHDAPVLTMVGGGTQDPRYRQLLSDILQRPLAAAPHAASSAYGAALSAARLSPTPAALKIDTRPTTDYTTAYHRYRSALRTP